MQYALTRGGRGRDVPGCRGTGEADDRVRLETLIADSAARFAAGLVPGSVEPEVERALRAMAGDVGADRCTLVGSARGRGPTLAHELNQPLGAIGSNSEAPSGGFVLVARGLVNKQIASELVTGERTVKAHRARVMSKMGIAPVADLARGGASRPAALTRRCDRVSSGRTRAAPARGPSA